MTTATLSQFDRNRRVLTSRRLTEQVIDNPHDSNPIDDIESAWGGDKIAKPAVEKIREICDGSKLGYAQKLEVINEALMTARNLAKDEDQVRDNEKAKRSTSGNGGQPEGQLTESVESVRSILCSRR